MSPLGLVIHWFIIAAFLVNIFVGCTPNTHAANCPKDFSLNPPRPTDGAVYTIECWDPSSANPSLCVPSSCRNYPVCKNCTETKTGIEVQEVKCKNEYHQGSEPNDPTMCVDSQERFFTCSGTCSGSLVCSSCVFQPDSDRGPDIPGHHGRLQRRANPFSASMYSSGGGRATTNYFGDNFNLRS